MVKGKTLNAIEHALLRPDTYIGSIRTRQEETWTWDFDVDSFGKTTIKYNPGLRAIIREIGSNVIDNKWRGENSGNLLKRVDITLDAISGRITFLNDGETIPVEKQEWEKKDHRTGKVTIEKMYPAEVFFGDMRSGTNYDDTEARKTSGKNGMGSKCTNVFSKEFTIDHCDGKKRFVQTYTENASIRTKPEITACRKKGYTSISFIPDYERFEYVSDDEGFAMDDDLIGLIKYYAYEMAAMLRGIPVFFTVNRGEEEEDDEDSDEPRKPKSGTEKIVVKDLMKFAKLHHPDSKNMMNFVTKNGDEAVIIERSDPSEAYEVDDIDHRSYVNGILTEKGGVHINAWRDSLIPAIVKAVNGRKRTKKDDVLPKASAKGLYPYFLLFVRCEVDRPEFTSQTKEELGPPPAGSPPITSVKPDAGQLAKILKWDFISLLDEKLLEKAEKAISRKEGTKKISMGKTYTAAGWAGRKRTAEMAPDEPKLLVTEGMSAKAMAIRGTSVQKNGRDKYGIMAIKGKFLNVYNASKMKASRNAEVQAIKKIIGLKMGVDYTDDANFNDLRYRSVSILTDADDDGIHIRGLLLNFFWTLFPSLLRRGFVDGVKTAASPGPCILQAISTPVVRVTAKVGKGKKKEEILFYSNPEFRQWFSEESNRERITRTKTDSGVKYYKGLGSINPNDAPHYFAQNKNVSYVLEGDEADYMSLGFNVKQANWRKEWITRDMDGGDGLCDDGSYFQYDGNLGISTFVDQQLIIYHRMALSRAIPNMFDGFKESQRKIYYGIDQSNFTTTHDLERVMGTVKMMTGYHHGAAALGEAIISMMRGFIGTNNIPLLVNDGEVGTLLGGVGKDSDAAQPRYSSTMLESISKYIFRPEDETLYKRKVEDNIPVEYEYYMPVIPMVLVNGAKGVASGYSTEIPNYNPLDLIDWIEAWMDGKADSRSELVPWYRNFNGKIELVYDSNNVAVSWISRGILEKGTGTGKEKGWWHIRALPIGKWGYNFYEELEYLESGTHPTNPKKKKTERYLLDVKDYSTANTIHYMIKPVKDYIPDIDTPGNLTSLKQKKSLRNIVVLDERGYPRRYASPEELLHDFCPKRLEFYSKRKQSLLDEYKRSLLVASNKYKFVKAVVDKKLELNAEDDEVEERLLSFKLKKIVTGKSENESFEYLLSMQMRSMTARKLDELKKEKDKYRDAIADLETKTSQDLWREDLDSLRTAYAKYLKTRCEERVIVHKK